MADNDAPVGATGRIGLPESLARLTQVVDGECRLPPGIFELVAPLRLTGAHLRLRGTSSASGPLTWLRRGTLEEGALYRGPLIEVVDASDVVIEALVVDGARFWTQDGERRDRRHPMDPDRGSPRFLDPHDPAAPPPGPVDPDLLISDTVGVRLDGLQMRNAVALAVAVGPGCRDVRLADCAITAAGDYGVWIGSGLEDRPLPLDPAHAARMPANVAIVDSRVAGCGAAGIYVEASGCEIARTLIENNHMDAPYDDESGQLVIDYKAQGIRVADCRIVAGGLTRRRGDDADPRDVRLLGTVGIEACGSDLEFVDLVIEGNSREGIQLLGARDVRIHGARTRIAGNHLAERSQPAGAPRSRRFNISVTTTGSLRQMHAVAGGLALRDIACENGIILWAHPEAADLKFDRLAVSGCDLSGPDSRGVVTGQGSDGRSVQGIGWSVEAGAWTTPG